MRFILLLILIMVITPLAEYFLPWWMIAVVPFLLSMVINIKGGASFIAGFLGIATFWYVAALMKDIPNEHLLSHRMAVLFKVDDSGIFLAIISFVGGLVGGLAAWSGSLLRPRKLTHPDYGN